MPDYFAKYVVPVVGTPHDPEEVDLGNIVDRTFQATDDKTAVDLAFEELAKYHADSPIARLQCEAFKPRLISILRAVDIDSYLPLQRPK